MAILLSLALMLTMAIPAAFADDTAQATDAAAVQEESAETAEEIAEDSPQTMDEAADAEAVAEEAAASEEDLNGITVEEISLDEAEIEQSKAKLAASNLGRKILIAGRDDGGRADIMIILCFTKENEAKIFTVARDTYMQLNPKQAYNIDGKARAFCKCNRAASYGGMELLMEELNRHLDLDIKEYIAVDWVCVATFIDEIGGLTANVEPKMLEWINQGANLGPYGVKDYKIAKAGTQTLSGWQAVQYLRVRKYDGGDARVREARNLEVFEKLYKQAQGWDTAKKLSVYRKIEDKIETNIPPAGRLSLVDQINKTVNIVKAASTSKASQYPFSASAKNYWDKWADMYYWTPITLEKNTIRLHKEFLGQSNYKASATVKSLSKTIAKHIKKKTILAKKPKLPSVAKATVTLGAAAYTGKAVTPSVTVKLKKKKLKSNYYTVTYKNNVNIGKASVTIEGRYGYGGTKTVTFDIKPAGTSLTGITAGSKSFTATWTQQAAKMPNKTIDGYQIQYGLKKNFKKAKTLTVAGYTNTTATIGKLKAKKKYYVRVRTYVGSGKSAVYSDWSAAKTVKPTK